MTVMRAEILEQPDAVARTLEQQAGAVRSLVADIERSDVRHVVIAARGTSDHAATYAKYIIEVLLRLPVSLAAPSVYTLYGAKLRLENSLLIGISQSGEAPDVVQAISEARACGALTACITNEPASAITGAAEHVLLCGGGHEQAVAATKTYTCSLALVALIAFSWRGDEELVAALHDAPTAMAAAIGCEPVVEASVERYRYIDECVVLARGYNQATALEAALKLTETCYVGAKAYSGADFLHGPIAMIDSGFPAFIYAPDGATLPFMRGVCGRLRGLGAEVIAISSDREILDAATKPVPLASPAHEEVSPLTCIVPGQLFACHLAGVRGVNPDAPRGLSKVTRTR